MSKIKIILANAPMKNGNKGCVALSISAIFLIDRILKSKKIDYELYLPDSGFRDSKKHNCCIGEKIIEFYDCDYPRGINAKDSAKKIVKSLLDAKVSSKQIFKTADFIFDIGQGDSFADIYGEKRFQIIDRIHVIARSLKKPYCLLPQTIGPFKNSQIRNKALLSIVRSELCMARDKQSLEFVQENVPQKSDIKEYIDVAFFLPYEKINLGEDNIHVGLNISGLLWNGGYTKDNQFGLKADYRSVIRAVIDYFLSIPQVKMHLISHVATGERNVENDYEICYELWREYNNPNLVIAPFAFGPIEAKSYIAGLDFFMGARMHSTIAAFSSGVPVIPMAYSRKFNGLFADTLAYPHMVDMKIQDDSEILSTIKESFENRMALKSEISDRMKGIVKDRCDMLVVELTKYFNLA